MFEEKEIVDSVVNIELTIAGDETLLYRTEDNYYSDGDFSSLAELVEMKGNRVVTRKMVTMDGKKLVTYTNQLPSRDEEDEYESF